MAKVTTGVVILLCVSVFGPMAGVGAAAPQGTLTIGITYDPPTMDPTMFTGILTENVIHPIMEPLLYLDPKGNLQPLLAESWQVVDPLTYVFRLRKGVKFHNGEPFTGKAVEFSWKRSQEKHRVFKLAFSSVARIDHVDDYTIRVVTSKPDPLFLKHMTTVGAAIFPPKHTAEQGDEKVGQRPVGTGPFVFGEWVKGSHITLNASPSYYTPGIPKVQTLVFKAIPESATRVAALQTGQVDIAIRIPPHVVTNVEKDANLRVSRALATRTFYVAFNNQTTGKGTPIMDPRVRLALNLGVDVQTIIRSVLNGQAERVNSLIGVVEFGYDPTLPPLLYDVARAKQLLAEAGHPQGFKIGMGCPTGAYANDKEICQAIAGYLERLGVEADVQFMESAKYWDLEAKKQLPPLFFDGWSERFLDPDTQLKGVIGPDSKYAAFEKKEFSDLIAEASSTIDQEARRRIYVRLARLMQADPPAIFLWQARNFEGARKRVQGYTTRSNESMSHVPFDVSVTD